MIQKKVQAQLLISEVNSTPSFNLEAFWEQPPINPKSQSQKPFSKQCEFAGHNSSGRSSQSIRIELEGGVHLKLMGMAREKRVQNSTNLFIENNYQSQIIYYKCLTWGIRDAGELQIYLIQNFMFKFLLRPVSCQFSQQNVKLDKEYQKLWAICKPELKKYIFCGVITVLHAGAFMYLPNIYNDINELMALNINQVPQEVLLQTYALKVSKWAGIFGSVGYLTYLRRYELIDVSNRISVRFRTVLYNHILSNDSYRRSQYAQACVHHLVTDVKSVSQFTGEIVIMGARGTCFLIGGIGCLLYYSPYLSIISVGIMSIFNLFFRKRNTLLKLLKQQQNKSLIQITEFVAQKFHSLRLIKISNTEEFERYQFARQLLRFYDIQSKQVSKANGLNFGFLEGLGLFSLFSVAAAGALITSYNLTNFSLIATSTYALFVALGFRSVISFNTELMKMMAIYANIEARVGPVHSHQLYNQPFLDKCIVEYEKQIQDLQKQRYDLVSKGAEIKIQNLYFSYIDQSGEKIGTIHQNLSLHIKPGSVVALVGQSGSGKTTLLNIITKLQQPQFGKVTIDGEDIQTLSFKDIQKNISYVTQDYYLFKGTFRQNLKYGNQHFQTPDERLIQCLRQTNAYDFVSAKGGLDGLINERGSNLSGGEKQRLILARALVKRPRLLLLDECTSAIDSESQKIIINNLKQNRGDMTTILISHKLQPFESIITETVRLKRD